MFDRTAFAVLLKKAMGDRTATQYSDETGVNRTYISKLLNEKLPSPPSPEIIKRLSEKAYNGVTYEKFMIAAGHLRDNYSAYDLAMNRNAEEEKLRAMVKETGFSYDTVKMIKDAENIATKDFEFTSSDSVIPIGKTVAIPILGTISAGLPLYAEENKIGEDMVPAEEVANGEFFYLVVKGESMIGSRIYPGDRVLVKVTPDIESKDIAVVMVDEQEATLKRVFKTNGQVILQPDNPKYEPIVIDKGQVRIIGKVVKVEFTPS